MPETLEKKHVTKEKKIARTDYGKVLVVAPSGYGKTFLAKTADEQSTGFINSELKPLSFKGVFRFHGRPKTWASFLQNIKDYADNPDVSNIIIDSQSMAFDNLHSEMKINFKGFDIYSNYNTQLKRYFDLIKSINKDVIVLTHDETVVIDGYRQRKAKVHGKEFEGRIEAQYTVVLFGGKKLDDGRPKYFLKTFEEDTSTKVPEGMFLNSKGVEMLEIPNDAGYIFSALEQYYSV